MAPTLVFFDVETSGFGQYAEVLQIAMLSDRWALNEFVKPKYPISRRASQFNGLSFYNGILYKNGEDKRAISRRSAVRDFLQYLRDFGNPCVLIAHNCPFGAWHLMRAVKAEGLVNEYREVILGFTDTLAMLRRKFPERRGSGEMKLTTLAEELGYKTAGVHDAGMDAYWLRKIAYAYFTRRQLAENRKSFSDVLEGLLVTERKWSLAPLKNYASDSTIRKLAHGGIDYQMLIDTFEQQGLPGVEDLLTGYVHGIPSVINDYDVINDIVDHLVDEGF